tara:strand:- start:203 stop:337 length:135 start_codon:yes stop_codon:yes gene_type:complete
MKSVKPRISITQTLRQKRLERVRRIVKEFCKKEYPIKKEVKKIK